MRYSELVVPDSAITDLIKQLEQLESTYTEALKKIRAEAAQLQTSLGKVSGATASGREAIEEYAAQTEMLSKRYKELETEYNSLKAAMVELQRQITVNTAAERKENQEMQDTAARLSAVQIEARSYRQEISSLTKGVKSFSDLTEKQQEQLAQLQTGLKGAKTEVQQLNRELGNQTREMNTADGSINQMRGQLRTLNNTYDNLSASVRNSAAGDATLQQIKKLDAELKQLEANTGRYQRNVGNYSSAFGMLGLSVQQVARELPSLAVNWNTFFLAISNNLPMLADQIQIANKNYKELMAAQQQGQRLNERAVPVWKQLISTLFSWQTALVAGITILSLYGKEIINWISDLFKARNAIELTEEALNRLGESTVKYTSEISKERKEIDSLFKKLQEAKKGTTDYDEAKTAILDKYGKYLQGLSDEISSLNNVAAAYDAVTKAATASAKARALDSARSNAETSYNESVQELAGNLIDELRGANYRGTNTTFSEQEATWLAQSIISEIRENGILSEYTSGTLRNLGIILTDSGNYSGTAAGTINELIDRTKEYRRELLIANSAFGDFRNQFSQLSDKELRKALKALDEIEEVLLSGRGARFTNKETGFEAEIRNFRELSYYREQVRQAMNDRNSRVQEVIGGGITVYGNRSRNSGRGSQPIDLTERLNEQSLEAQRSYEEARTAIMEDGIEKRRTEAMDAYNKEVDTIRKQLADAQKLLDANATAQGGVFSMADDNGRMKKYVQLTAEQVAQVQKMQDDLGSTLVTKQTEFNNTLETLDAEHQAELLKIMQEGIDLRLQYVKKGSDEELQLLLERNEKERQLALAQNKMKPESERQDEGGINARYDVSAGIIQEDFYMSRFDQEQKLAESEFALLQTTEAQKTAFRLTQEKERYEKILQLNEQYGKQLTDTEIQTYKNLIAGIDKELNANKNGVKQYGNIFEMLGITIKDKDGNDITAPVTDAINTVFDVAKDALNTWMEARLKAAEESVRLADQEVEEAQSTLDYERQLKLEGLANNVETAQKELQLKKQQQQKALQQQRKIQAQQVALDSVMQASSMIVASANIWAAFSKIPIAGPALAIAAIATMWGSFLASRVKAMQLAKNPTGSGTETYGEGTVELLQGGSHQSGRDIDLGRKPDGTRRRAEGGEFFAVINKRSSRRYRNVIPDVIRSLNNGSFADKYLHAYDTPLLTMPAASSPADLSRLEKDVREIRQQNTRRYYVDGNGNTVMKYKNLTRTVRK